MLDLTNQLKNRFIFYLGRDGWKPIQAGIQLSTSTVLNSKDSPSEAKLTEFKTYGGLTKPSELVHGAILLAENVFRSHAESLKMLDNVEDRLWTEFSKNSVPMKQFPPCHDVLTRIVRRYFRLRIHIYGKTLTEQYKSSDNVQHGSRSAYCRTKLR